MPSPHGWRICRPRGDGRSPGTRARQWPATWSQDRRVFTAGTNQVRFQTARTEITRVEPDGTVLTSISGKSVEFTGLQLQTNLETGETVMINEPHVTDMGRFASG